MDPLEELVNILSTTEREDLLSIGLEHLLSLTGTTEGQMTIINSSNLVFPVLIKLLSHKQHKIAENAATIFINLSSGEKNIEKLFQKKQLAHLLQTFFEISMNPNCQIADSLLKALANFTRQPIYASSFLCDTHLDLDSILHQLINALSQDQSYNKQGQQLHFIAALLSNLTQNDQARRAILNPDKDYLSKIITFINYSNSEIRRRGTVGVVRNLSFDTDFHEYLLDEEKIDILPKLLYPLAGPEEFDDEDMDNLPIDLQYLPQDKTRESVPSIRQMLLEALLQLLATRSAREYIRSKNAYLILRELHKIEESRSVLLACENAVDILIKKEDEINEDNLKSIEVPEDLQNKFSKDDREFIDE